MEEMLRRFTLCRWVMWPVDLSPGLSWSAKLHVYPTLGRFGPRAAALCILHPEAANNQDRPSTDPDSYPEALPTLDALEPAHFPRTDGEKQQHHRFPLGRRTRYCLSRRALPTSEPALPVLWRAEGDGLAGDWASSTDSLRRHGSPRQFPLQ